MTRILDEKEITINELSAYANDHEVWDEVTKGWVSVRGCRYLKSGRGFAPVDDPFMPITAITVYLQWLKALITVAMPPKGMSMEDAQKEVAEWGNEVILYPNSKEGEGQMLDAFITLIDDADVISGWNSEGYDIPYTVNRIKRILSKNDLRRLCLWDKMPRRREFERYGKTSETYDLIGRVHLDSLQLYRKYTFEERHTYRLDAIGELEVGERKTVYEGTLDQLYNNNFRTFIEYNRQDVSLLDKLDQKLKFIDLTNVLAHANTVLLQTTMGAVAVTEQAIINEAHHRGLRVPNRNHTEGNTQAAGAYVAFPKKGLHTWIGSMDLNSLYPSVIRSLNMGPETVIGQLRPDMTDAVIKEEMTLKKKTFAGAWEGRFGSLEYDAVMDQRKDLTISLDWETGKTDVLSGAEIYKLMFDSNAPWMISANGTIFTTEFEGVIPGILKRWHSERKEMQAMLIKAEAAENGAEIEFWDKRQLVKKINLNS
jgi:DNA polymerase elongation subunit (family B)